MTIRTKVLAFRAGCLISISLAFQQGRMPSNTPESATASAMRQYIADLVHADSAMATLEREARARGVERAKAAFIASRVAYKHIEWLAEHYTPLTAAALNGPALDRPDDENPALVIRPTGLQVIAELLYARDSVAGPQMDTVANEAHIARVNLRRLRERANETRVTASQLFDAARNQIARVVALGIEGTDTPTAGNPIREAAANLRAVASALESYSAPTSAKQAFASAMDDAIAYLDANGDVDRFDRFAFIVTCANPLARTLGTLQSGAGIARLNDPRAWSAKSNTLFDDGAFSPAAFAPPGAMPTSAALVQAGEQLFHDTRLSGAGTRSCASCHVPQNGFTDGRRVAATLTAGGGHAPARNTPTLLNAALQSSAFADARVAFLEDQVKAVIESPFEMGGNIDSITQRVASDTGYQRIFRQVYGHADVELQRGMRIRHALAAYVRSLTALNSRFDRAMRGERDAINTSERRGFNLFAGKAKCGTCHFLPLFNGVVPPTYLASEGEILGVPRDASSRSPVDPDRGIGAIDRAALHDRAFKVPTIRNVALTAPYMHNGVFTTLRDVVEFYNDGGGAGRGLRVPNQTLPAGKLGLSEREKSDLIAFMRTLTDTSYRTSSP